MELNLRPMNFITVIDEVMRSMQATYDAKGQSLVIETAQFLPPVVGDNVRLTQILTNLVSNASKYSPDGSVVTLRTEVAMNQWDPTGPAEVLHVSVKDEGYGISLEDQRKLFTKFFRADNNKGEAPGTGLGLNIVKQMVELGGGKVWFDSEPGKGSTFHFTMPLANPLQLGTRPLGSLPRN
jgi:signal transduction histidine kinase